MTVNASSLFFFYQAVLYLANWNEQSCLLVEYDLSRVCSCHFPGWLLAHIYNMENMVPQELLMENFGDLVTSVFISIFG